MAASGLVLFGFVVAHMAGNLKVFEGERAFDEYAAWLRRIGAPVLGPSWFLWGLRVLLVAAVAAHITAAVALARRARKARPVGYRHRPDVAGAYAARTMRWGGVILALFVVYHVLDLTAGVAHAGFRAGHPYRNVVGDFRIWYVTLAYTLAVAALGLHVRHGVYSAVRSLGGRGSKTAGTLAALVVALGFLAVPAGVVVGVVR